MPRFRTAAVATLLVVPMVTGGFLLQEQAPQRANAVLFDQVLSLVRNAYVDTLPMGATYEKAATGLVKELNDPYSELLPPKEAEGFNRTTGGRYGGTGMLLGNPSPGVITVDRVFPNTPAEEAGVREGDHVLQVDTTRTATISFDKVSDLLRGTPGSKVSVVYGRPGVAEPIRLQFTRRVIHIPAVNFATLVAPHVGYIPLQTFNENAADEVAAAVDTLVKQGATSLVLDMRDNGGGIVDQALETASLFLPEGKDIVSVRARNQPTETARSSGRHLSNTLPLVVLIDGGSASATEIVAGALQDHDRALILGTTSFGKGLVQSVYSLQSGYQLKLTTGKWYTPSGRSIHRERKLLPSGDFVEIHPDSLASANLQRPTFKSDAGRVVYGGGGIRPDVVITGDTLTKAERDFVSAAAPKGQAINTVIQNYALELKGTVPKNFPVPGAWSAELMRRLNAAGVQLDTKYDTVEKRLLTRDLSQRVARMSFGESAAKLRVLDEDRQLLKAIELLQKSATQAQLLAAAPPSPAK
jgi:carboxyl-terminal processing protease